jgi:hypothetical protein
MSLPCILEQIRLHEKSQFHSLKALLGRIPDACLFVRQITFDPNGLGSSLHAMNSRLRPGAVSDPPAVLLPVLPNVTTLRYYIGRDVCINTITPSTAQFLSSLPGLKNITLECTFEDIFIIEEFLHSCGTNLQTIDFEYTYVRPVDFEYAYVKPVATTKSEGQSRAPPEFSLAQLKKLVVGNSGIAGDLIAERLFQDATIGPINLNSLVFVGESASLGADGKLIDSLSASLQELSLHLPSSRGCELSA